MLSGVFCRQTQHVSLTLRHLNDFSRVSSSSSSTTEAIRYHGYSTKQLDFAILVS